jgi:hypothetical protein
MGIVGSTLSFLRRLLCCVAGLPAPDRKADDDVVFDEELLSVDGEALRRQGRSAGDEAASAGAASQAAYRRNEKAEAKRLSLLAAQHRAAAAAAHEQAARALFAQRNRDRGVWSMDLHALLVAEAEARVKRRLLTCQSDASESRELCIIVGQGCVQSSFAKSSF